MFDLSVVFLFLVDYFFSDVESMPADAARHLLLLLLGAADAVLAAVLRVEAERVAVGAPALLRVRAGLVEGLD